MEAVDIRLAVSQDRDFILELFNSHTFLENGMRRISEDALKEHLSDGFLFDFNSGNGFVVLFQKNSQALAGCVKIVTSLRNQVSVISGGVLEKHYGNSFSKILLNEAMRFLFENYPIARIEMNILATNSRSIRFHEKMGFTHEGTKRRAWFCNGALRDQVIMSLLREEFATLYMPSPVEHLVDSRLLRMQP